ncbi:hypothetical protein BpHYR1_038802 [Brachionus plicatilis]|uniref:Uncharacterized protein n=1 Tax=Brachionus plicatilis TaxID=10195 RepID=A0A3M7QBW1_BRAPC|nr:hypothetical protein BpHYR1_038802 [Brachionus plicatilis]
MPSVNWFHSPKQLESSTRRHEFSFQRQVVRNCNQRFNFFTNSECNRLPVEIVHSETYKMFKMLGKKFPKNQKKRKLDNGTQNVENKLCSTCIMLMAKRRYFLIDLYLVQKISSFSHWHNAKVGVINLEVGEENNGLLAKSYHNVYPTFHEVSVAET